MKKLILTAALLGLTATAASAQTAQQDVNLTATVPKFCTIAGITNPSALAYDVPVSANGTVTTTTQTFTVANATCNTAADVTASSLSGGIKSATAAPTNFTNIIDYTGTANLASTGASTINTATVAGAAGVETGNTVDTLGAVSGNLVITVAPAQPSSPLVAGSYADTLRVTLFAR